MNKSILAAVVIILFIFSGLAPMTIGYNINLSDETTPLTESKSGSGLMNSSWPMFGHDVKHTGRSPYAPNEGNTASVKWKFWMDGMTYSSPSINDNGTIYIGAQDHHDSFFAFYPNGTEKWHFDAGDWVSSSPAIADNGIIYFGCNNGKLYSLNPDGTKRWYFNAGGWVFSSPTIDEDGTIYVGSTNHIFYAINPNGTEKWRYETGYKIYSSAAIDDIGIIYFGSHDYYIYALYQNGSLKWKYKTNAEVKSPPAIGDDGTIYVCSWDNNLYAIYPNGTLKWKSNLFDAAETSPTIAEDGTIYVGSYNGRMYSINPNGSKNWYYQTGDWAISSPAIDKNGVIYFGSVDGNFYALNPDGSLKWKYDAGRSISSSPAISEYGTIYIAVHTSIDSTHLFALNVIYNEPPSIPSRPSGETNGKVGNEYTYTTSTTDPNGNNVSYYFDWGDGSNSGWVGPFNSGETSNASHTWTTQGIYEIKVKAKDIYDAQSDYSDILTVTITKKSKSIQNILLSRIFERFPLLNLLLQRLRI